MITGVIEISEMVLKGNLRNDTKWETDNSGMVTGDTEISEITQNEK